MTGESLPKNGFTLLEVAVSLLIVGFLIGAGVVEVQRARTNFNLQVAADRLAQDIRSVQQRALSEKSSNYSITFYPVSNDYTIKKSAHPVPLKIAGVKLPSGVGIYQTNFKDEHNDHKLWISEQGLPTSGGTIILINRLTGKLKYVIVASITGRVRVSDYPPKNWGDV